MEPDAALIGTNFAGKISANERTGASQQLVRTLTTA